MTNEEKHPLIIPANHHISTLLIKHYHEKVVHQGRHFTEGALRTAGLWIIRAKKRVPNFIKGCVICKNLSGQLQEQNISDLPTDKLVVALVFFDPGMFCLADLGEAVQKVRGGQSCSLVYVPEQYT